MGFKSLSAIILHKSKLQYSIEVISTGLWTIGQCDLPTFLAGFPLLWTPGELHDKQDKQFLIGQNHTFMVLSWRVQRVWMTKSSVDDLFSLSFLECFYPADLISAPSQTNVRGDATDKTQLYSVNTSFSKCILYL